MRLNELSAEILRFDGDDLRILRFTPPGQFAPVEVPYTDRPAHRRGPVLVHQRVAGLETVDGITLIPALSVAANGARGRVLDGRWVSA